MPILEQVEEIRETFGSTNDPLPARTWYNQSHGLWEISGAARVPSIANNSTVSSTHKTATSGRGMYVEALTEDSYGNFGNSWGLAAGLQNNTSYPGAENPGYLVRYQFNNATPVFFRMSGINPGGIEFLQIGAGDAEIPLSRGDSLGLRVFPLSDGSVYMEATHNGEVVASMTDPAGSALKLGNYGALRMSRSSAAGSYMTGTAVYSSGPVYALASRTALGETMALSGNVTIVKAPNQVRDVLGAAVDTGGWAGFLGVSSWRAELDSVSPWHTKIEGSPVIAGSIEEIRIGILYSLEDEKPLPTVAQVQIGAGEWKVVEVDNVTKTRALVKTIVGPLARGSYPVHVKFSTGDETPIVYAGSLAVV